MNPPAPGPILILDTNILLDLPQIETVDWGIQPVTVYILDAVLEELRGLARERHDKKKARDAQRAAVALDRLQQRTPREGFALPEARGRLFFVSPPQAIKAPLDANSVDHQQIALAQSLLQENPGRFCVLITRDREMADIAGSAHPSIPAIVPGWNNLVNDVQRQLERKLHWWRSFHAESLPAGEGQPLKRARPRPKIQPDRQVYVQRTARRLYARIRSARHRAIVAIAPLEARLALSAQLATVLTARKQRVIFLFVADAATAAYWAGELRRRCQFPAGSILNFGDEPIARPGQIRIVLYRHDQIERRLDQHVARFRDAGRRVTAVVDACDLIDPVEIALLLFECDQFIGFTRHATSHAQAVSGRMLDAFFQEHTVAGYTFADAEQDRWLDSFDVIRRPVFLEADEEQLYIEINAEFIALHRKIENLYPELKRSRDFWQSLHRILERSVEYEAAHLFVLRERREAVAQLARRKLDVVTRLVTETKSPARCLAFDHEQLWSKVLEPHLSRHGKCVVTIPRGANAETWEVAWRDFANGKIDCLLLSEVPPPGLGQSQISRLLLVSPLTPLAQLAAVTDWTLSHNAGGAAVAVDLLYAVDTPEQHAMTEFADVCCGLRFSD
jgi:hypothetical protein